MLSNWLGLRALVQFTKSQYFSQRALHTTSLQNKFWESHPKGPYRDLKLEEEAYNEQRGKLFGLKDGFKDLRTEIGKWSNEWKERITDDTNCYVVQGDRTPVWKFDDPQNLKSWAVVSDSDNGEGYSQCQLGMSATGKGSFQGFINTRPPKDGKIKRAGYCSMRCHRITKSFHRESYLDWTQYTHLVMRVRGDGRSYLINISTAGFFDITWNDVYHYVLYTRGGPYWQFVKIPFSKFVHGSKGRVQDKQNRISLDRIAAVGLAVGKEDGPFSIEVDYIGVECDHNYPEEFAYEMYRTPPFVAGV